MTEALRKVRRAAQKTARTEQATSKARNELRSLIQAAHAEGASLRAIAEAAGLSHMQVHRIVKQDTSKTD